MLMDTGSLRKLNGNTRAGQEPPLRIFLAMILQCWAITHGSTKIRADVPTQSVRSAQTHGAFMMLAATYGNGATTFTKWTTIANLPQPTLKDPTPGKLKSSGAVRGGL